MTDDHFGESARWQSWLDVEAELALAQGELGMIPGWAAERIAEVARLDALDRDRLRGEIATTLAPVAALARVLAEAAGEAGAYVHWGATTQNVIDTGRLLVLRRYQGELDAALAGVLERLSDLAETHARTVMVGRTNRQHALPITFGFKVAGWIEDALRVAEQLDEVRPRLFQLRFGGAIGAYQSFGEDGPRLAAALGRRLGLGAALVPNRTGTAPLIEYLVKLASLGLVVGRIADELYLLMQEEIAEVREVLGDGVVGSSTMPHKTNPKHVVDLRARANLLRGRGSAALSVPPATHEGDAATNREVRLLVEQTCPEALAVLRALDAMLARIEVDAARMRANAMEGFEFLAMETVMMRLAPSLGRGAAHDLLHRLVHTARSEGTPLRALLDAAPEVRDTLDAAALDAMLDPVRNAGQSAEIARAAADAGRRRAAALRDGPAQASDRQAAAPAQAARPA